MADQPFKFYSASDDIKSFGSFDESEEKFTVVNKTTGNLEIFWINYSGQEIKYSTLQPDQRYPQSTISTHAWAVRDGDGNAKFKFYPNVTGVITAYDGYQEFSAAIKGTAGDDTWIGTDKDDQFEAGLGNDSLNGGDGIDRVMLPGKQSDYEVSYNKVNDSFNFNSTQYGNKELKNIEKIAFLGALSSTSTAISLDGYELLLQYDVTSLQTTGKPADRVNLFFVSEGYTESERSEFLADAARMFDVILGSDNQKLNSPHHEYRAFFNVSAIFVPSKETGIDDSLKGETVETIFNAATYGSDGRLGYGDWKVVETLLTLASVLEGEGLEARNDVMVAGLMNTALDAGSGGVVAWAGIDNEYAGNTIIHELGHAYAKLHDEYLDPALANIELERIADSVHVSASETELSWSHWLGYEDELGTVGAYEGGFYRATGVWRATETSAMLEAYKPFSAPQKEEYIRRFYENVGDYLSLSFDDSKIKALVLEPKVLSFSWSIDGKVSGTTDTLNLETLMSVPAVLDATPKHQEITVATVDSSGMIRKESIIESTKQNEKIDLLLGSNKADRIIGTSKNEVIIAGRGNDKLMGGSGDDILIGGLGDDILIGGTGNNFIDGGAGIDTAIYNGSLSDFSLSKGTDSWAITLLDESDSLVNIERLQFTNTNVALDLDGNAGQIVKLLGALLGKESATNKTYVGMGLNILDNGMPYEEFMKVGLDAVFGSNPSGASVVGVLYKNLVGSSAPQSVLDEYGSILDNGSMTATELGIAVADNDLNATNIDLIGLAQTGVEYILYG